MRLLYLTSLLIGVFGQRAVYNASHGPTGFALDKYHSFAEIKSYVENTIGAYENVTVETIGQTYENNDLLAVIIDDHQVKGLHFLTFFGLISYVRYYYFFIVRMKRTPLCQTMTI